MVSSGTPSSEAAGITQFVLMFVVGLILMLVLNEVLLFRVKIFRTPVS